MNCTFFFCLGCVTGTLVLGAKASWCPCTWVRSKTTAGQQQLGYDVSPVGHCLLLGCCVGSCGSTRTPLLTWASVHLGSSNFSSPRTRTFTFLSKLWADHRFLLPGTLLKFQSSPSVRNPKSAAHCVSAPSTRARSVGSSNPELLRPSSPPFPPAPSHCAFSVTPGPHLAIVVQSRD